MKKQLVFTVLLALGMVVALNGCGGGRSGSSSAANTSAEDQGSFVVLSSSATKLDHFSLDIDNANYQYLLSNDANSISVSGSLQGEKPGYTPAYPTLERYFKYSDGILQGYTREKIDDAAPPMSMYWGTDHPITDDISKVIGAYSLIGDLELNSCVDGYTPCGTYGKLTIKDDKTFTYCNQAVYSTPSVNGWYSSTCTTSIEGALTANGKFWNATVDASKFDSSLPKTLKIGTLFFAKTTSGPVLVMKLKVDYLGQAANGMIIGKRSDDAINDVSTTDPNRAAYAVSFSGDIIKATPHEIINGSALYRYDGSVYTRIGGESYASSSSDFEDGFYISHGAHFSSAEGVLYGIGIRLVPGVSTRINTTLSNGRSFRQNFTNGLVSQTNPSSQKMSFSSDSWLSFNAIPEKYTEYRDGGTPYDASGTNPIHPPLVSLSPNIKIKNIPNGANYVSIVMDHNGDYGAGKVGNWGVFNIPVAKLDIAENEDLSQIAGVVIGDNCCRGEVGYLGPEPRAWQTLSYSITIFAHTRRYEYVTYDEVNRAEFLDSMKDSVLDYATHVGYFTGPYR